MTTTITTKLFVFALGAFVLVLADYLYGTTYYTNVPTDQDTRFLISGLMGYFTTLCYGYGLFGYTDGFLQPTSPLKRITLVSLAVFTVGVGVTHSLACGYMYLLNAQLLAPDPSIFQSVLAKFDAAYNVYLILALLGVTLGYSSLGMAIATGKTVFPKQSLLFFPLLIVVLITVLDTYVAGYPILLKSAAWSGVLFNLALIAFAKRPFVHPSPSVL